VRNPKKILVTQRVVNQNNVDERRDALDNKWSEFLCECGILPIILPNTPKLGEHYIKNISFVGILLTGGNDLASYGGDAPKRDELEFLLLDYSVKHNIPLIGVCRGMQMILNYLGIPLKRIGGHIRKRHNISIKGIELDVNSYHEFSATEANEHICVLARSEDDSIEAVKMKNKETYGIMWHPEREMPFSSWDIGFFKEVFK